MSITPLPSAPAVTDTTAEFNTKAFAWVAALGDFTTETNALATQVSDDADTASTAATNAAESELAAVAAANYKGEWSTLSGALNIPASVSHNGAVWVLTQNLANVTTDEPGVNSPSKWLLVTLPAQAGNSGKFLSTNGNTPSWETPPEPIDVKKPTNVSPANSVTGIGPSPTLTGSTYYDLYSAVKEAAQWQISTSSTFSTTVLNTGDVAGTGVTYSVPFGTLSVNTTYYWRVRYKSVNGVYSDWSDATTFATAAVFGPTTVGQSYGGGYYGGIINDGGTQYYLLVAPKASGEWSSVKWFIYNEWRSGATSTTNGPSNTASAHESTSYTPAISYPYTLSVNGYDDWYLPAKDELEVLYYNLKPYVQDNNTSSGVNTNAVPSRSSAYTTSNPAQTTAAAFKSGGSEQFGSGQYWSSTQASQSQTWNQSFYTGGQGTNAKDNSLAARAVRRMPVNWE